MLTVLSFLSLAQLVVPAPITPPTPVSPAAAETDAPRIESPVEVLPPSATTAPSPQPSVPVSPVSPSVPATRPIPATPPAPISPPVIQPVLPPQQVEIVRPQDVRPLPGQLDAVPVFNSNSPEVVQGDGILLSTFAPDGMSTPVAHLNFPLQGRFDIFAHHIAKGIDPDDDRTMFLGIILHNPTDQPVTVDILQAVSYLSQDAPFTSLPSYVANPLGTVYAGPGSRTTNDVLRGERQSHWPDQVTIEPRRSYLLVNAPIPLRRLTVATDGTLPPGYLIPGSATATLPQTSAASTQGVAPPSNLASDLTPAASLVSTHGANPDSPRTSAAAPAPQPTAARSRSSTNRDVALNGRSLLMHLSSSGPVYVASLAMHAPKASGGMERVPTLEEWENLLRTGNLATPRDRAPTSPDSRVFLRFFYGRVAGVSQGSQWTAVATDSSEVDYLSIPQPGEAFSYALNTVDYNTFGTGQIQSAPMLVRYPDTAYRAHGNYGTKYDISLPLYNNTGTDQQVTLLFQTPIQDEELEDGLRFRDPPDPQVFFRGTVRLRYTTDLGIPQTRYMHLVQQRGQQGEPLLRLNMPSGDRRLVEVQFIYPPDATPPQVITVQTEENPNVLEVMNPTGGN